MGKFLNTEDNIGLVVGATATEEELSAVRNIASELPL